MSNKKDPRSCNYASQPYVRVHGQNNYSTFACRALHVGSEKEMRDGIAAIACAFACLLGIWAVSFLYVAVM